MNADTDNMAKVLSELWGAGYKAGYKAAFHDLEETRMKLDVMIQHIDICKTKEGTI